MVLTSYGRVTALPGVRMLFVVTGLARIPVAAAGVTITLHVVLGLGMGYGEAGAVAAATTLGMALGGPLMGRLLDRRGLRRVLLLATIAAGVFWAAAPWLPYWGLMVLSFVGGLLALPVMSIGRQAMVALLPEDDSYRRPAFSLDSVLTEISYMVGPSAGVFLTTAFSSTTAMLCVGTGTVLSGVWLYVLDPPVKSEEAAQHGHVPLLSWLRGPMIAVLVLAGAMVLIMAGAEVAIVAALRVSGQVGWSGLVIAVWCLASVVGGIVHGAMRRPLPLVVLMALVGVTMVPVGLLAGQWWLLALALVPNGLLCAPTFSSTSDAVTRLAPESVRGTVMGVYSSAYTVGAAIGAPLIGFVMDNSMPLWGFVAAGGVGLLGVATAVALGGHKLSQRQLSSSLSAS
ncbi:MFS transporter [Kutzneria chonburiensis]|uniref:MFS transporter n=1 Tax=Kutzneria chonburiensis TaxID=1483604 RepID=A0ABV6N3K1_9PSEU|nr:MFS transporter [Kutzneria chonburiensis]